ncbi:aspartyl-phosphate phosphatase Spo0E family protein [Paenibacillus germinis]|nr:aspartyl-phosphate phosphatase Spo0E family protein [Paenibacillus germinis]
MENNDSEIRKAIEAIREEMTLAVLAYGLESTIVLRKSKELDDLLNRFERLKSEGKAKREKEAMGRSKGGVRKWKNEGDGRAMV